MSPLALNVNDASAGVEVHPCGSTRRSVPLTGCAEKLIARDKVTVMMGAWSYTYTLAVMPKLMEYKVPMVVETSSADKITTAGKPYIFRISPTNGMEAVKLAR